MIHVGSMGLSADVILAHLPLQLVQALVLRRVGGLQIGDLERLALQHLAQLSKLILLAAERVVHLTRLPCLELARCRP